MEVAELEEYEAEAFAVWAEKRRVKEQTLQKGLIRQR